MPNASARDPFPDPLVPADPAKREKSIVSTSNMASERTTNTIAIDEVEPWRCVDRAERARRRDDDDAEQTVHQGHRSAVNTAKHESSGARARLRPGADDRQIDRNHRQHAGGQVQRQPAKEHEQQDGQGPASLEPSFFLHAVLGVLDEGEEVVNRSVTASARHDRELSQLRETIVTAGHAGLCHRRSDRCGGSGSGSERDPIEDLGLITGER